MDSRVRDLRSGLDQDEDDSYTHNRGAVRRQWGRVVSAPKQAGSQCSLPVNRQQLFGCYCQLLQTDQCHSL